MPLKPRLFKALFLGTAIFCWSLPCWGNAWSNYSPGLCSSVGLAPSYRQYSQFTSAQSNTFVTLYRRANMAGNGYTLFDQDTLLLEDQFGKRYYSAYKVIDPTFIGRCDEPLNLIEQTLVEVLKTPLGLSLVRQVLDCSSHRLQRHFGIRSAPAEYLAEICRRSDMSHPWVRPSRAEEIEQSLAKAIADLPWFYLLPKENWGLMLQLAQKHQSTGLGSIEILFSPQVEAERQRLLQLLSEPRQYTFFVSKDNPSPIDSFTDGVGHQTYLVVPIQPKREHGRVEPSWAQPLLDSRFDFSSEIARLRHLVVSALTHETLAVFFDSKTNFFQNPGGSFQISGAGSGALGETRAKELLSHPLIQDAFVAFRAFAVERDVFTSQPTLLPDYQSPVPNGSALTARSCIQTMKNLTQALAPISLPLAMRNVPRLLRSPIKADQVELLSVAHRINRFNLDFAVKYGRSLGLDLLAAMDLSRFKLDENSALKPLIEITDQQWADLENLSISFEGGSPESLCVFLATPRLSGFNLAFQSGPRPRIKGDGNFDPIKMIKKTRKWQFPVFQGSDK